MGFGISGFERRGLSVEQGIYALPALHKAKLFTAPNSELVHPGLANSPIMVQRRYAEWIRAFMNKLFDQGYYVAQGATDEVPAISAPDGRITRFGGFKALPENWENEDLPMAVFESVTIDGVTMPAFSVGGK